MSALPVEESRAKRQQRLQSRFRDRGGIFVPSEKNTLIDILLARSVTGESPSKRGGSKNQRAQTSSPVRGKGKAKALTDIHEQDEKDDEQPNMPDAKAEVPARGPRKPSKKPKVTPANKHGDGQPVAGPSRLQAEEPAKTKPPAKRSRSTKGKATNKATGNTEEKHRPPPKRKGRPPKTKDLPIEHDLREVEPDVTAPKPRGRAPKPTSSTKTSKADAVEDAHEPLANTKKAVKKRGRIPDSEDEASSDYMPTGRKRARTNKAVTTKVTATTTRKKKPAPVTQLDDSDDDGAIIISVKKKSGTSGSAKPVETNKEPVAKKQITTSNPGQVAAKELQEDAPQPSLPKPKSHHSSKPKKPVNPHNEEDELEKVIPKPVHAAPKAIAKKAISAQVPPLVGGSSRGTVQADKLSKSDKGPKNAIPEDETSDADIRANEAKSNHTVEAPAEVLNPESKVKGHSLKTKSKTSKRQRDVDVDVPEPKEKLTSSPTRKRAKYDEALESDEDTLVASIQHSTTKDEPNKFTKLVLKENAQDIGLKQITTTKKPKKNPTKPSQAKAQRGPPRAVSNHIKARRVTSSPQIDSDTDPLDFLS